ncbi:MAG: septum site-determining protein MinD [Firmicutes bacterium]|nr:septum site-determining protein MinD [Bacillota bacterium]
MGKAIVITSGKGGVGKTTTTANIGAGLAALGKQVALVDADIGLRNLDLFMGLENRVVYHLVDVIEGRASWRKAIIRDKRLDNLVLLPSAQVRDKDAVTPEQMKQLITELKQEFDFVILDCPAGIERGFRNAIAGADQALVVVNPEVSSVRDADRVIGLLEAEEISDVNLVINRLKPNMVKRGEMLAIKDIVDLLAIRLIGVVPEDEKIVISSNRGEPIALNQTTKAGLAFYNISRRLLGEEVPFEEWQDDDTFFSRLKKLFGID